MNGDRALSGLALADRQAGVAQPSVAVLMGTYCGARYLDEQLASLVAQKHENWALWVSDDGSTDGTVGMLEAFAKAHPRWAVRLRGGPKKGYAANFASLSCAAEIQADHYAFADQDDIWCEGKLARAVGWLSSVSPGTPALYCARTLLVDADNHPLGMSPLFARAPSFANALVQCIGGGNTMVFNDAARRLICAAGDQLDIVSHDWWAYLLVTGCGGEVFYDTEPHIRYRQHGANLVGSNIGFIARLRRARALLEGRFHGWNERNIAGLMAIQHLLTEENRWALHDFVRARKSSLWIRMALLRLSGVHRQTRLGNLGLAGAAVFNKL